MDYSIAGLYMRAKMLFLLLYMLPIIAFSVCYFVLNCAEHKLQLSSLTGVSTISIMYLMASIFGAFYLYNNRIKTLHKLQNEEFRMLAYTKWLYARLFLVGVNITLNAVLYSLTVEKTFLFAAGIGAVALLFCQPNKNNIENELYPITEKEDKTL